jgi:arginine repressor
MVVPTTDKKANGEALTIEEQRKVLRMLFEKREIWGGQKELMAAFRAETGETILQPKIAIRLKEIGAHRVNGGWILGAHKKNLEELQKIFDTIKGEPASFYTNLRVSLLLTKPRYNTVIAEQIYVTFPKEVLTTFCPDENSILIFAKKKIDDGGRDDRKSTMEQEIRALCKKQKNKS